MTIGLKLTKIQRNYAWLSNHQNWTMKNEKASFAPKVYLLWKRHIELPQKLSPQITQLQARFFFHSQLLTLASCRSNGVRISKTSFLSKTTCSELLKAFRERGTFADSMDQVRYDVQRSHPFTCFKARNFLKNQQQLKRYARLDIMANGLCESNLAKAFWHEDVPRPYPTVVQKHQRINHMSNKRKEKKLNRQHILTTKIEASFCQCALVLVVQQRLHRKWRCADTTTYIGSKSVLLF